MSSGLDLLGWVGGGMAALAYVLVSTRRIVPDAGLFQGLNMVGAALLCVASFNSGALPSACMNIAWILFGVQSLVMASRRGRHHAHLAARAVPDPMDSVSMDSVSMDSVLMDSVLMDSELGVVALDVA